MTEKVKVSREVGEIIKSCVENAKKYLHTNDTEEFEFAVTQKLTEKVLCGKAGMIAIRAFLNGYEVEETPEEILLERYVQNNENRIKAIQDKDVYQEGFALGYSMGVKDGLNFSNKKIKGINE